MARLFGDYTDLSYETPMYKSLDIREPRYKVIILAAPIVPLSRGLTVIKLCNSLNKIILNASCLPVSISKPHEYELIEF